VQTKKGGKEENNKINNRLPLASTIHTVSVEKKESKTQRSKKNEKKSKQFN
jgi:hypothetical protein